MGKGWEKVRKRKGSGKEVERKVEEGVGEHENIRRKGKRSKAGKMKR